MAAHYVDNQRFLEEMTKYQQERKEAKDKGLDDPMCPEYIGECFMKIANRLSYRPNFINYAFRDDMISDGIENCVQYMSNFNPEKSKNPFSYFTDTPTTPDLDAPDLASEVRSRVEQQKARIASSPKMYPFYFERAKQGKFVKAKCKLGKNKKTKLL